MMYLRSGLCRFSCPSAPSQIRFSVAPVALLAFVLTGLPCIAQDQPRSGSEQGLQTSQIPRETVTIPAGTRFTLVLSHPIESRHIRRGDDIYAQVTSPVGAGNQVAIPPGTFVQGTVDKLEQKDGRAFLHLQSMAITFPDGFITPVAGPITLNSNEGYAIKDVGGRRGASVLALPLAGAGIGALIGHSVGKSDSQVTSAFPPGCTGVPPFCSTTTTPVFGTKAKDTIIGSAIGAIASFTLLFGSHQFFMDVGSPVEMTLERPLILQQDEVAKAVEQLVEHPAPPVPVAQRPVPPPPDMSTSADHGTCYTPGTPGTPPTVIPGPPGADGIPGPPTVIPGTPPMPGTPYPCP
jgi:hypothetical protein